MDNVKLEKRAVSFVAWDLKSKYRLIPANVVP